MSTPMTTELEMTKGGGGGNPCFINKCFEAIIDFFRRILDYESYLIHYHSIYDII